MVIKSVANLVVKVKCLFKLFCSESNVRFHFKFIRTLLTFFLILCSFFCISLHLSHECLCEFLCDKMLLQRQCERQGVMIYHLPFDMCEGSSASLMLSKARRLMRVRSLRQTRPPCPPPTKSWSPRPAPSIWSASLWARSATTLSEHLNCFTRFSGTQMIVLKANLLLPTSPPTATQPTTTYITGIYYHLLMVPTTTYYWYLLPPTTSNCYHRRRPLYGSTVLNRRVHL